MRIISSEELALVAGGEGAKEIPAKQKDDGGVLGAIGAFLSGLFGNSGGGGACVPSTNTSGGITTTQSCGAGGVSSLTTSGPGFFTQSISTPNAGGSASATYGIGTAHGNFSGGYTTMTTTCISGRCTTVSTGK